MFVKVIPGIIFKLPTTTMCEAVLGYGDNHADFPITMLFKQQSVAVDTINELAELFEETPQHVTLELQDDLFNTSYPDQRVFKIENFNDYMALICDQYVSKKYHCYYQQCKCFTGITVAIHDEESDEDTRIEKTMAAAKKWTRELKKQGRIKATHTKLRLRVCCC